MRRACLRSQLVRLHRTKDGASAVEFAILAPVLAMIVLGMIDTWSYATTLLNLQGAVQAGAKYVFQGGRVEASIEAVALAAWRDKPDGGDIDVTKACTCSGATVDCATVTICAATKLPPVTSYSISGSAGWSAPFEVSFLPLSQSLSENQVVRAR